MEIDQPLENSPGPNSSSNSWLSAILTPGGWQAELGSMFIAILAALIIVAGLIALTGTDPLEAYQALFKGSIGSRNGIGETLVTATPLLIAGLGAVVAFKCGVWNIGIDGQLFAGALGAALVGIYLPPFPGYIEIPLVFLGGFIFGAGWAAIPGFFKARWNANEILTTIMLNYIAIRLVSYLVSGPIKDDALFIPLPQTAVIHTSAQLPIILSQTRAHAGFYVAILVAIVVLILLQKTRLGFEIKSVGKDTRVARYGGIPVGRSIILAFIISGGLAGMAGASEISGVYHYLQEGFSPGYGELAIVLALLGGLNSIGTIVAALFFGALVVGAGAMQRAVGIPTTTVYLIQGIALMIVLAQRTLRHAAQQRGGH